ncbi:MAG: hypothetical protein ACPF9D_01300 [Owenweeksia sp.]
MKKEVSEIRESLHELLKEQVPPLKIRNNSDKNFEVAGTKEAMQGKQKVNGFYFASVVPKPKDVRLYFFPIYTHSDKFSPSDELKKFLKGKSCFHIKYLSPELEAELKKIISKGVQLYQQDGLI